MVQHPRSRSYGTHVSSDKTMSGITSQLPQVSHQLKANAAHDFDRHEYFRGHALAGPSMRAAQGALGDSDVGHLSKPDIEGGSLRAKMKHSGFSFGSASVHQGEVKRYRHGGISKSHYPARMPMGRTPSML